jgi:outer membrane autotransporter protein
VNVSRIFDVSGRQVATDLFCGWAHEFLNDGNIKGMFRDGITNFRNSVDSERDDSVYFGAGLSTLLKENVSAYVRYEGDYSSGNSINGLNVGVTVLF